MSCHITFFVSRLGLALRRFLSTSREDGLVHTEATELLHTKTPSHIMDAGLRGALGRSACALQNLVSVESPTACDRIHLVLAQAPGPITRSPLRCLLCDEEDAVDNNSHVKTCPATAQHRTLRFLRMAEVMASILGRPCSTTRAYGPLYARSTTGHFFY